MTQAIRVLVFSSLYPSSVRPGHGIFVETRLRELISSGFVAAKVVAPVPWFFSTDRRFGEYARLARIPGREFRNGIDVLHPRYFLLPKIGMVFAPFGMALGAIFAIRRFKQEGFDFDLIDAHYFYPDGVAAALLAWWFRRPFVVTARGSDINLIAKHSFPRLMIRWAALRAAASIAVSEALASSMSLLGIPRRRIHVMRNGVDMDRFAPVPAADARKRLGLSSEPILLSVGNLVENKGHHIVIAALAQVRLAYPEARLVIVGEGPEYGRLEAEIERLGLQGCVWLAGAQPNEGMAIWYSAADVCLLASSREGWPNVLLESLACGTPVVATRVGGVPEIVRDSIAGLVIDHRTPDALARAVRSVLGSRSDRQSVRDYAAAFGWKPTTDAQSILFSNLVRPKK